MNPSDTLTTLFSHHLWANLRLFERCATLTDEQLNATVTGGYGSIRNTLQHIVAAERSYFSRLTTGQRYNGPKDPASLTIAEMIDSLRSTGSGFIEWAGKVEADDTVQIEWEGSPRAVPKTIILTQVIYHATDHRAQIAVILTQLGIEPPDIQAWSYFDEIYPL